MPRNRKFFIFFLAIFLFPQPGRVQATTGNKENQGQIAITPLVVKKTAHRTAELCDEAREWYDEGLLLADNSEREASYYRKAVALCPDFIAAHNRLARIYKLQKKYALSIEEFERARIEALASKQFASRSGSRALFLESSVSLGEIYAIQGKYESAAREYSKALQLDPDALAAQNNIQYVYKRQHRYDHVLSPNNEMLNNAIFTRIAGTTRPRNTYRFDIQYHQWAQAGTLVDEMFDDPRVQLDIPPSERKSRVQELIASIRYGVTNELTIGLIPKYFSRTLTIQLDAFDNVSTPTVKDWGDTEFLLKYHFWGKTDHHLSAYTLFNIPTGKNIRVVGDQQLRRDGEDADGNPIVEFFDLVRYIPFGSESYDVSPGLAWTFGFDNLTLQGNLQYTITDGEIIGDQFLLNNAALYRINPSVVATMELNYRWRADVQRKQQVITFALRPDFIQRERVPAGALVLDTTYTEFGGNTLFLSPGLKFTVAQGVSVEFGLQIPVIRQSLGVAENTIVHLGMTVMTF